MAGRNARIQTVNNLCKAAAWRLFFYSKYFVFLCVLPPFSFPYNCKRKASGTNTNRKAKNACTTRAKAKAKSACTTLRAERKAARQSVEQIRLTVSGLVTANTYQSCYAMAYIMRAYPYSFRVYGCKRLSCKFVPRLGMSAAYMTAHMCWICARAFMLFIRLAAPAGVACLFKFLIKRLAP